jgi:hypothetical protein
LDFSLEKFFSNENSTTFFFNLEKITKFLISQKWRGGEKNLVRICRLQRSLIPWLPLALMMVHHVFVFSNRVSMLEFWRIKLPTFYKLLPVPITILSSYNLYVRMYIIYSWLCKVRIFKIGCQTPLFQEKTTFLETANRVCTV